ncbi:MAG: hypothetical protein U1F26_14610 [Lysobacterales bacterium]
MKIFPITLLLTTTHAFAVENCTIDGLAASIISSASREELVALRKDTFFDVDPLAREPILAKKATVLTEKCQSELVADPDVHVRAMALSDPSWIVRASLLAASRKLIGSNASWNEAVIGFAIDYLNSVPWPNPPKSACQPKEQMKTVDVSFSQSQAWYTFRAIPYLVCPSGGYEAYLPEQGWVKMEGMQRERLESAANAVHAVK